MSIKLQRAEWTSEDRHTLQDLGDSYELPSTCNLTKINLNKNKNSVSFNYKTLTKNTGYQESRIEVNGTLFIESSSALAIAKKNEIIRYINQNCLIKVYQDKNDDYFYLASVEEFDVEYERRRSIIKINISFVLDEPFYIYETKNTISYSANGTYSITNNSNVEFIPEEIFINNDTDSKNIVITIRPSWAADDTYDTVFQKSNDTSNIFYPKNLTNFVSATDDSFNNMLKIPAGDYKIIITGNTSSSLVYLKYYERGI